MMDDWIDYPVQFPNGSLYDLRDESAPRNRLEGLRSVKNLSGGIVRPAKVFQPSAIGFHRPVK